ncbi:MAG TPA: tetratricopeptide repeat protein [Vitreimonas sp.]|jgi:TPR repeat protein|nr:tetratricopeptide repeat protein [Vitreimonas sp.]
MFRRVSKLDKGLDAFERGEWRRARRLLEESMAEEERAIGHYHVGLLYWNGYGCKADKAVAVAHFARAAEDGLPGAQTAYGIALRSGVGVAQDLDLARAQFRAAAGAQDGEAMVQLASLSEPEEAHYWLLRASENGYTPAMAHLAELLMSADPVEALSWLYADVALSGDDPARKRAAALARECTAKEISVAQKRGRLYAKEIQTRVRGR